MNITSTTGRIALVLVAVSALAALAGVAQAGSSRPASMSEAEYRALTLRSEALNQQYGIGAANRALMLRSEALNQKYGIGADYRALMLRSQALNRKYGLGRQEAAAVASQPTSTRGFAWGAFGIGAAVMLGLALVTGGFFVRRRLLAVLRGVTPRYRTT